MNGLLQFIRLFSALSLFTAAFWVLVPKGRGEKTARFALGVFFLWSVILGGKAAFSSLQAAKAGTLTQAAQNNALQMQTTALQNGFGLLLQSAGYPAEKIIVEADILEDNSINITKVVLWPKNSADYNAAAQLLARQAGLAPEILQQGEAYGTTGN